MNIKDKAKYIISNVLEKQGKHLFNELDKALCLYIIDEIIESLKITTGHCSLNRLDEQEVNSDLNYWYKVKQAIRDTKC